MLWKEEKTINTIFSPGMNIHIALKEGQLRSYVGEALKKKVENSILQITKCK